MDTPLPPVKNPLPLHKLIESQPAELKIVSVRDLPDFGVPEDHLVVLVVDEAGQYYAGGIVAEGGKPAKGETWKFTRDDNGFIAAHRIIDTTTDA